MRVYSGGTIEIRRSSSYYIMCARCTPALARYLVRGPARPDLTDNRDNVTRSRIHTYIHTYMQTSRAYVYRQKQTEKEKE